MARYSLPGGDFFPIYKTPAGLDLSDVAFCLSWLIQIAFGLQYIHKKNILHRDLKTQNIFLTSQNIIKIGDFGISKVAS